MSIRAFSLIEIVVAVAILLVLVVAVIGALSQSARTMKGASDHTLVSLVTQKVVEETQQSFHDNPFADSELAALATGARPIAHGRHPHFAVLEDSRAPYGRLETGVDLSIEPVDEGLYRLYREFQLRYALAPVPGNETLLELGITWAWDARGSSSREETFVLRVPRPRIVAALPTGGPPGALDEEIRSVLYSTLATGTPLTAAVGSSSGDLDAVRRVGLMVVPLRQAIDELNLANPPALTGGPPSQQAESQIAHARAGERKAALAWSALLIASPIAEGFTTAPNLGTDPQVAAYAAATLARAQSFRGEIEHHLGDALEAYVKAAKLLQSLPGRPYRCLAVEKKVLVLAKLQSLLGCASCLTFAQAWVTQLGTLYSGGGHSIDSWIAGEKKEVATVGDLERGVPEITERVRRIGPALQALDTFARKLVP